MNRDLPRWPRLAVAAATALGLGVGVAGTAVVVGLADGDGQDSAAGAVDLVAYDGCDSALSELRSTALEHVGPFGIGGEFAAVPMAGGGDVAVAQGHAGAAPAAPRETPEAAGAGRAEDNGAAGPNHSSTNTHESGVDEPDLVKTDGRRVVSIVDGVLRSVDVASHRQTVRLALPSGSATQLLIDGDRALVLTASGGAATPVPKSVPPAPRPAEPPSVGAEPGGSESGGSESGGDTPTSTEPTPPGGTDRHKPVPGDGAPQQTPPVDSTLGSQLVLVDLTGSGRVLGRLAVDGDYVDARQVGSVARVVVRSGPRLGLVRPDGVRSPADATDANRGIVAQSSISDWLPRYQLATGGHTETGQLVDCGAVSHPRRYTGTAMLTVLTFDLRRQLGRGDPVSIVADGNTVYGTGTSLYIADDHHEHGVEGFSPTDRPAQVEGQRTEIYQFDISGPGRPVHVASGGVAGSLLNQYSLSEHEGSLRVVTTVGMASQSHSMINVLTRRGDKLVKVGHLDGLGTGERIHAVRFIGDTGYVVTFRRTDPLYTIDLSDPGKPRVTGELKITGYSAYLHPAGDGRLIGVGQEATQQGRTTGTQVSLFDTSNPAAPKRIAQYHLPGGHSEAEGDPHAFLYWPAKHLVVLPVSGVSDSQGRYVAGALVLRLSDGKLSEAGMVTHRSARTGSVVPPRRTLVIGDELWTVSEAGILVSDVDRLTQVAWLPF